MGNVEDFENAENQRQSQRDDEQPRCIGKAIYQYGGEPADAEVSNRLFGKTDTLPATEMIMVLFINTAICYSSSFFAAGFTDAAASSALI